MTALSECPHLKRVPDEAGAHEKCVDCGAYFRLPLCEWCRKPLEPGSLYDLCDDCEHERELEEVLDGMEAE